MGDMNALRAQGHVEHFGMLGVVGAIDSQTQREQLDEKKEAARRLYFGPGPECAICAGTAPRNPRLCDTCQIYDDARHVFYCRREVFRAQRDDIKDGLFHMVTLREMQDEPDCMICQQITTALHRDRNMTLDTKVINGGPYSFQHSNIHDYVQYRQGKLQCIVKEIMQPDDGSCAIRCVLYVVADSDPLRHFTSGHFDNFGRANQDRMPPEAFFGLQLVLHYSSKARRLCRVNPWDNPMFSSEPLLTQLHVCELTHGGFCGATSQGVFPDSFRLVDILRRCIVDHSKIGKDVKYVALSYPWALREQFPLLTTSSLTAFECANFLSRQNTPDVVWDAMAMCRAIGERYLWVDRLCILQDDAEKRQAQIRAMNIIYQNALVTIVAARSDRARGLPGTVERPRPSETGWHRWRDFYSVPHVIAYNFDTVIDQSLWQTRAWTFQEGFLSRRGIVVTDFQVYFVCASSI
jgi:hypothetical protein